jgi:hypothetical protein
VLLLFFAITLTAAQQAHHDRIELSIYQWIHADQEAISDLWPPSSGLMNDYKKAQTCYTNFHLYKATDRSVQLRYVEGDLGNVEVARAGTHDRSHKTIVGYCCSSTRTPKETPIISFRSAFFLIEVLERPRLPWRGEWKPFSG